MSKRFMATDAEQVARQMVRILAYAQSSFCDDIVIKICKNEDVNYRFGLYCLQLRIENIKYYDMTWLSSWPHEVRLGCESHAIKGWVANVEWMAKAYKINPNIQNYYLSLMKLIQEFRIPNDLTKSEAKLLGRQLRIRVAKNNIINLMLVCLP